MKRLLRSDGFDVIVVGSGLAGLSAALTVAEFGYSPVILEKTCEPGGLTRRASTASSTPRTPAGRLRSALTTVPRST